MLVASLDDLEREAEIPFPASVGKMPVLFKPYIMFGAVKIFDIRAFHHVQKVELIKS